MLNNSRGKIFAELPANNPALPQGYIRHEVAADDDCGYTAFGITRNDAAALLNNHLAMVIDYLRLPIQQALLTEEFPNYLLSTGVINREEYTAILQNPDEPIVNLAVFNAYINYDVRDKRIDQGWAHPRVLQALAHIRGIELHMWELGRRNVLIPHHVGDEDYASNEIINPADRRDLLYINGNHFEQLELTGYGHNIPTQGIGPASLKQKGEKRKLPESWEWLEDIFEAAHLPHLGMPVQWNTTKEKHTRIAFDPTTNTAVNLDTLKVTKYSSSPVGFIDSTEGRNPMPGAKAPAAARYTRYMEPKLHQHIIQGAHGEMLVPCIAHGDYVKVEALQADHMLAKDEIIRRQCDLVKTLNEDRGFASLVMNLAGAEKFFVKVNGQYYGTLYFYELYFNDIDNIWLICQACNLHKSNEDTVTWLKDQWLYGEEFIQYLGIVNNAGITDKVRDKNGLAEVAVNWFWERHANHASVAKKLMEDVVTPIQILNQRVDCIIGAANADGDDRRARRHIASLDFRLALLEIIATMRGVNMPKQGSESSHSSSDQSDQLQLKDGSRGNVSVTESDYRKATEEVVGKVSLSIIDQLKSAVLNIVESRKRVSPI